MKIHIIIIITYNCYFYFVLNVSVKYLFEPNLKRLAQGKYQKITIRKQLFVI